MSNALISLKVITPTRVLYEGEVKKVLIKTRGENGEFAVLPNHAPLTADIGLGTLEFTDKEGEAKTATLFGGYTVVFNNNMVIMARVSEWPWEIDKERAEAAKERAERHLQGDKYPRTRVEAALLRAVTRLKLYELKK